MLQGARTRLVAAIVVLLVLAAPRTSAAWERLARSQEDRLNAAFEVATQVVAQPDVPLPEGLYAVLDPTANEVYAAASCDDDGDYVVVVSRGLFEVAFRVATALVRNDMASLGRYFLTLRNQAEGTALPSPPAAFFERGRGSNGSDAFTLEHEILVRVMAPELMRVQAHHVHCANPTAHREAEDAVWTEGEHKAAWQRASDVRPGEDFAESVRKRVPLTRAMGAWESLLENLRPAVSMRRYQARNSSFRVLSVPGSPVGAAAIGAFVGIKVPSPSVEEVARKGLVR
jgi:hypothetical protein